MKIVKISADKAAEDTGKLFVGGKVTVQRLIEDKDSNLFRSVMVNFSAGAKNKLHTHSVDQILYVTKGKGIVATNKEEHVVTAGMMILIPANEPHWHGATKDSAFSHISITGAGQTQMIE